MPTAAERMSLEEASRYAGSPTPWTPEDAQDVGLDPNKGFIDPRFGVSQPQVAAPETTPPPSIAPGLGTKGGAPIAEPATEKAYTPPADFKPVDKNIVEKAYVPPSDYKPLDKADTTEPKPAADTTEAKSADTTVEKAYTPPTSFKPVGAEAQQEAQQQQVQPKPPLEVPIPTPEGPTTTEELDPQAQQRALVDQGYTPGYAQAIVAGKEPKTISGEPPKTTEEPKAQAVEPEAPKVPVEEDPVLKHYREVGQLAAQAEAQHTLTQPPQPPPEKDQEGYTGVADYFRKRGDEPIRDANDPRLTTVGVGNQNWRVHREAAPYFQGFLNELAKAGAPVSSSGGWVYRAKAGTSQLSEHAYGGAIDVNQTGRNEVTPEFRNWLTSHPGALAQAEQHWHIYGGERFGDLGHFEWGGSPGAFLPQGTKTLNVTHFGYANDPDLDPESKAGHGKYVHNMVAGYDVALNAAGAREVGNPKPGEKFTYQGREYRYGDKVPEKYADARFDVFDPNFSGREAGRGSGGGGGKPSLAGSGGGGGKPSLENQPIGTIPTPGGTPQLPEEPAKGGAWAGDTGSIPQPQTAQTTQGAGGISFFPTFGGGGKARRVTSSPEEEEEEEEDPLVTALMTRGFTRAQALGFALSSRALISPIGVRSPTGVPTQPPPAPTQPATVKPLALPPPSAPSTPSAATATGTSVKPSPGFTLPSKQPQISAGKVSSTPIDKQAVVQALTGMGIKKAHAQQLVANAQGINVDELLRNALRAHGQSASGESGSFRVPQETPPPAPTPKSQEQRTTAPIVEPVLHKAPVPEPEPRSVEEPTPYPATVGTHNVANPPSFAKLTPGLKLSEAVKEHARLLSEDDPRVKKQADGMIKGEHFVPGDPVGDQLIAGLPGGRGGPQHRMIEEAEEAIREKRPMHLGYLSAPKEAEKFPTRESRTVQYDESSPEARLMGSAVGQLVGHSMIPLTVGVKLPTKAGESHQSYIQGLSTNVMANNFQHVNEKLASMGVGTPYKSLGHKFYNDLEGYFSNLNAGHTGTGRGYAVGTEHHPNEPDTSHVPYKLSPKEADFINLVINNTAAFAKHEDAQKLRQLARANGTLITEDGETNRMRHNIEQHEPGWRQRVLEPSIRSFKTGLIVAHHRDEQNMPQTIRPGKEFQDLTRAIQRTSELGRPDVPISVSLHHSFQDNRVINKIERDFSENRIDEAEARRQLEAMGEDPNEYRFHGGSGGLITPYEDDPESITPEEHTQMRDNLRKQWVGGKLNVEDYRRKAAEVPLPSKPSQLSPPSQAATPVLRPPSTSGPEESEKPEQVSEEIHRKKSAVPLEPETEEEAPEPKAPAPKPEPKPKPEAPLPAPAETPSAPGEAAKQSAAPEAKELPPAPGDVLPPVKEKKGKKAAKSPEQIAAEKEDLVQADLHRKKITPEQQTLRDEVQRKAQAALDEKPESDPLSAHHYINGHAQFPDWVGTKEHIGKHFDEVNPKLDYAKEEHRQRASDALTHDVLHGLAKNSAASDWYDDTVDKTLNHIGQIAPKILTDKDHEMAFKLATAITSQGQDVFPNFESGYHAYRHWHRTGKMPEDASVFGGGPKAQAMIANFKKINQLWKDLGADGLREVLEKKMTMRQLRDDYGIDIGGESPDHEMEGASMLGPKIGSFYNNLNKRFHSTTFDLWATRNLNRIAGKMLKFSPTSLMKDSVGKQGPRLGQLSRLDGLLASGMIEGADNKQQKVMRAEAKALRKLKNVTRERVLETAPTIAEWAGREHNRYMKGTGGRSYPPALKSLSTSLAKNMDLNLTDLADAPRGPKQRKQFRDIYQRLQDNLAKHGIDMKHANNQAVLWYIEQKLFQLGGSRNRASFDYLDAAHRLVRKVKSGELPALHEEQSQAA